MEAAQIAQLFNYQLEVHKDMKLSWLRDILMKPSIGHTYEPNNWYCEDDETIVIITRATKYYMDISWHDMNDFFGMEEQYKMSGWSPDGTFNEVITFDYPEYYTFEQMCEYAKENVDKFEAE